MKVLARDEREFDLRPSYRDKLAEAGVVIDREQPVLGAVLPTRLYSYVRTSNGQRVWAVEVEVRADVDAWVTVTVVLDEEPRIHHIERALDPLAVAGVDLDAPDREDA